ncbi:MAG: DUF5615 family PIN-like protein [Hyphomonadaceae bacterium]|nr:DUF5615 family PIN-like protein [Hyphomonadaceae bacterium]
MYKFLADESCPDPVVDALEEAGFDIVRSVTTMRSATDDSVLAAAVSEGRIVIAQDRDFGELILRRGLPAAGYVLLRLKGRDWTRVSQRVVEAIQTARSLENSVLVINWTTARIRPLKD